MNRITVNKVEIKDRTIEVKFNAEGIFASIFTCDSFFVEYNENIENTPYSIAIIPFLCNVLPIIWVYNGTIQLQELDKQFFENLNDIKKGYIKMYPKIKFEGNIIVDQIIDNSYQPTNKKIVLFSGGVDAFSTLVSHINETPILTTIWGSDIALDNVEGWNIIKNHTKKVAQDYNLDSTFIKSNFRDMLNYTKLNKIYRHAKDYWWHGFQHGIGLIGLTAALVYKHKIQTTYIASSFDYSLVDKITCASNPNIDNHLHIASCNTIHDGCEYNRPTKIKNIDNYCKSNNKTAYLRVCWISDKGENCCNCEKCFRTTMSIVAIGADPNEYGLIFNEEIANTIHDRIKYEYLDSHLRWESIQKEFNSNNDNLIKYPYLTWFSTIDLKKADRSIIKLKNKILKKLKKIVKRIIRYEK